MKTKGILALLIAVFTVSVLTSFVSASGSLNLTMSEVTLNSIDVTSGTPDVGIDVGDTIPIRLHLFAGEDLNDVTITASIIGEDSEDRISNLRFESGHAYPEFLSLKMPSKIDENLSESYTLEISVESDEGYLIETYDFTLQRKSYSLEILSVEASKTVTAGSNLGVDVVIKNRGAEDSQDTFVTVRIAALNLEKRAYLSDLSPTDDCEDDCDNNDAAERIVTLAIPSDAKAGVYNLEVEVSNADTSTKTTKTIVVQGSEQGSDVLSGSTSKDVNAGETVSYDLVIVNSGDRIATYEIVPENAQNLVVSVDEPIVAVPAGSSKIVKISATAGNTVGTFNFAINVNSKGELVQRVNLAANVKKGTIVANNVVVLTVILAVIFIVLLIVLIVLLTRKPEKTEEFGESYY